MSELGGDSRNQFGLDFKANGFVSKFKLNLLFACNVCFKYESNSFINNKCTYRQSTHKSISQ
jgi:hypothetical protein